MRKKIWLFLSLLLIFSLVSACTNQKTEEHSTPSQSKSQFSLPGVLKGEETKNRPLNKKDVIKIEGDDYEFEFKLFRTDNLGFTTYFPIDPSAALVVNEKVSSEGDEVVFKSDCLYNGEKRDDIYFSVFMYPQNINLEQAINLTKKFLETNNSQIFQREDEQYRFYKWALHEFDYKFMQDEMVYLGTVAFGQKEDRIVRVLSYLPEEFIEGFIPLMDKVLTDLEWWN